MLAKLIKHKVKQPINEGILNMSVVGLSLTLSVGMKTHVVTLSANEAHRLKAYIGERLMEDGVTWKIVLPRKKKHA